MPAIKGQPKKLINYKIPHDLEKKVDNAIENGEFSSQADLITAALHFFFNKIEFEKLIDHRIEEKIKELVKNEALK